MMTREQRRLAAVAAFDCVGYSRLMGQDESGTHSRLMAHLGERLRPAIARNGGRLIKLTGDGALVEFGSAVDVLRAAIEFQQAVAEIEGDRPDEERIKFRAGVHLGDLIVDGGELYGDGVNIAVRLEAQAPAGGIVISSAVREAVDGRLKATLHTLGELSLRNITRPVQAFRVEWEATDWEPREGAFLAADLGVAPAPALALSEKPSIAVLPFQNMSGEAEQEYFVDGLVEDIITSLSRISLFFVIARNSSFIYKGRTVDVRQVGIDLGVRYVLGGSVRRAGNRLRITGQLIDTAAGNYVWAERFDGALEDVFELQDKITSSVVAAIEPRVQRAEVKRAQARPTENLGAYDLYLRALSVVYEITEASVNTALELLDRAIAIDPNFSSAHGLVANCYWYRVFQNWGPAAEAQARGLEAAELAIETGREDPVALARGGLGIAYLGGRPHEGLAHIERALALNPNFLIGRRFGGWVSFFTGDHKKSIEHFERSMELSPMDPGAYDAYAGIAWPYFFTGRYEDAMRWADKALGERPTFSPALCVKAVASAMANRPTAEVAEAVRRWRTIEPNASVTLMRRKGPAVRQVDRDLFDEALRRAGLPE
jgi:adenylate cyclase